FSVLMRSSALPLAILIPVIGIFGAAGSRRERITMLLMSWTAIAITLSPVALRNHQLFDRWSVARSGSGASLLEAWGPWADGGPGMEKIVWPPVPPAADEFARDQIYRQVAIDWARQHTGAVIRLAAVKAARTWSVVPN